MKWGSVWIKDILPMFLGCKEKLDLNRKPDAKASGYPSEVDNS